MPGADDFTVADLLWLAETRNYGVRSRGDVFWLINLTTRLPEPNELGGGISFSLGQAQFFLRGLSAVRG